MLQSVDRVDLIRKLQEHLNRENIKTQILLQVNIGDEPQKGGLPAEEVIRTAKELKNCPNLLLKGLMCIPPNVESEKLRYYFKKMRDCYKRIEDQNLEHVEMKYLSMGMSGDYEIAIEEGSNMVRVGSAIFGSR